MSSSDGELSFFINRYLADRVGVSNRTSDNSLLIFGTG